MQCVQDPFAPVNGATRKQTRKQLDDWTNRIDYPSRPIRDVLLEMVRRRDNRTGRCTPSMAQIAVSTRYGMRTVKRAVSMLLSAGAVSRVYRYGKDGKRLASSYQFHTFSKPNFQLVTKCQRGTILHKTPTKCQPDTMAGGGFKGSTKCQPDTTLDSRKTLSESAASAPASPPLLAATSPSPTKEGRASPASPAVSADDAAPPAGRFDDHTWHLDRLAEDIPFGTEADFATDMACEAAAFGDSHFQKRQSDGACQQLNQLAVLPRPSHGGH